MLTREELIWKRKNTEGHERRQRNPEEFAKEKEYAGIQTEYQGMRENAKTYRPIGIQRNTKECTGTRKEAGEYNGKQITASEYWEYKIK